jgi:hypothetical protein
MGFVKVKSCRREERCEASRKNEGKDVVECAEGGGERMQYRDGPGPFYSLCSN